MVNDPASARSRLFTLTELETYFDRPRSSLEYAIRRGRIKPSARVGITRLWDLETLPLIKSMLTRLRQNRRGGL